MQLNTRAGRKKNARPLGQSRVKLLECSMHVHLGSLGGQLQQCVTHWPCMAGCAAVL